MPVAGHTSVKFSLGSLELWLLRRSMHAQCGGGGLRPARVWPVAARSMVARRLAQARKQAVYKGCKGPSLWQKLPCPPTRPHHPCPLHSTAAGAVARHPVCDPAAQSASQGPARAGGGDSAVWCQRGARCAAAQHPGPGRQQRQWRGQRRWRRGGYFPRGLGRRAYPVRCGGGGACCGAAQRGGGRAVASRATSSGSSSGGCSSMRWLHRAGCACAELGALMGPCCEAQCSRPVSCESHWRDPIVGMQYWVHRTPADTA